jgi:hypothetical protein
MVAEPLFNLLTERRKMITYEGGHRLDPEALGAAVNAWLDETFGPVKPTVSKL